VLTCLYWSSFVNLDSYSGHQWCIVLVTGTLIIELRPIMF
jgi:hypothetical protein